MLFTKPLRKFVFTKSMLYLYDISIINAVGYLCFQFITVLGCTGVELYTNFIDIYSIH